MQSGAIIGNMYTTRHLAALFEVHIETIRLWAVEFAEYLSPTARPGSNRPRQFSQDDLGVLTLVSDMKRAGRAFVEIHATLKSGQRAEPTVSNPEDIDQLASVDRDRRLALEVERLSRLLQETRDELERQRQIAAAVAETRDANVRLQVELSVSERERQRLEGEVARLNARIIEIAGDAGYHKGVIDGLREKQSGAHE